MGLPLIVHWTHQADRVAVRILNDRVPRSPEGIVWFLLATVASGDQVSVRHVNLLPRLERETHDHVGIASARASVEVLGEAHAVEFQGYIATGNSGPMVLQ